MRTKEITDLGIKRLRGNFPGACALTMFLLIADLGTYLAGRLGTLFFDTMLLREKAASGMSLIGLGEGSANSLAGILIGLALSLGVMAPLRLNIKNWYQHLTGEYHSLKSAFHYFSGGRSYISALWFTFVRNAFSFLAWFFPLLPSMVIAALLNAAFSRQAGALGAIYGVFVVLLILLTLLAVAFSLYIAMGLFFMDYVYILGAERNPFKAASLSWRLMVGGRPRLLRLLLMLLPYGLLCLLLAPIPFALPNIQSTLAAYAEEVISEKIPSLETTPAASGTAGEVS